MAGIGTMPGEVCGRDGCEGVLVERMPDPDRCTCFSRPPCPECTRGGAKCPDCGEEVFE